MLFHKHGLLYYKKNITDALGHIEKNKDSLMQTGEVTVLSPSMVSMDHLLSEDLPELKKHCKTVLNELQDGEEHLLAKVLYVKRLPGLDDSLFEAVKTNTENLISGSRQIIDSIEIVLSNKENWQSTAESVSNMESELGKVLSAIENMSRTSQEAANEISSARDILVNQIHLLSGAVELSDLDKNALSWFT